jgi:hypothetical protein
MIDLIEHCRQRSTTASGWRATRSDPKLCASSVDMAKRWREVPDLTEAMDRVVADMRKPR